MRAELDEDDAEVLAHQIRRNIKKEWDTDFGRANISTPIEESRKHPVNTTGSRPEEKQGPRSPGKL